MKRTPPYEKSWRPEVKRLWKMVHEHFDIEGDALETLRVGCDSLESFFRMKDRILVEGETFTTTTGQIKANPCVTIQKNALAGYLASMRALNLEWGDPEEKRNVGRPGVYGI